jgi:hypothetical protein
MLAQLAHRFFTNFNLKQIQAKGLIFLSFFLTTSVNFSNAQNYNPFVNQASIAPSPLFDVASLGVGTLSFAVGNAGSNAIPFITNQEMILTISLSKGIPNNFNPIAAIGGSFAGKFTWLYDAATTTYQGTQNQIIPSFSNGGTGVIIIAYKVMDNSIVTNPQNGFNINITPPPFTNGINPTVDDQVSIYTWTIANVITQLNLTCFIQDYYIGSGMMLPVLLNQGEPTTLNACDTVLISLRNATAPYGIVHSAKAVLQQNGSVVANFSNVSGNFYIVVHHRNALPVWSAMPVAFTGSSVSYNFSTSNTQSYGNNMIQVSPGIWAFYSGDLVKDENIDLLDLVFLESDIGQFNYGYQSTDLNGDGNVDLVDEVNLQINLSNYIYSIHP